ncbi:MAG TPA: hypothetical protein VHK28_00240 [Candidatus Limnocylindria bacterium]|nr:hypothetical protein [Candidatus Limnocylindria bacterium]
MITELPGFPFPVVTTHGLEEKASRIAERTRDARAWMSDILGMEPRLRVEVLGPGDFAERAELPALGLPHMNEEGTMFLAGYDTSTFDSSVAQTLKYLSPADRAGFALVYGEPPSVQPFVDLLSLHELAHAYHMQRGWSFQELWMGELFCNLALQGYVANHEPAVRAALETLPASAHHIPPEAQGVTSIGAMNAEDPLTYVWYEFRLQVAAIRLWDAGGPELLREFYEQQQLAAQDNTLADASRLPAAIQWVRDAWPDV